MLIPPLNTGDKVMVIATAKRLEKSIQSGIDLLESWGLEVLTGQFLNEDFEYFAATDEQRAQDLQTALDSSEVKAIFFARGGYGTTRILDQVDFTQYINQPKWTIGFSDLTSFLLQCASMNIPAIHGPMVYTLGSDAASDNMLKALLFGENNFQLELKPSKVTKPGTTKAEIIGGNLSLLYESIGASNELQTDGKILFLEEVGEDFYSVDRMLNKLKRVGKFDNLKGVIIGDFTNVKDGNNYFQRSLDKIINSYFETVDGPLAFGFPGGHEKKNFPLIFNSQVEMGVEENLLKLYYLD